MPTHDIILAIDISGSMASTDMNDRRGQLNNPLTRLDVVKQIGHQFINQRTADKLGLVFFGSSAFVSSPLTLDQDSLHNFLEKSQIGFAGQKTAIGDAIGLAIKKIQSGHDSQNNNTSFIVLLSDGSNTSGEVNPIEAAKIAAKNNIKIYTIGIGKVSDNPLDILTGMSLDEKELKAIADTTNGQYFHADSKQSLIKIYNQINNLEPNNIENKTLRPESEWFIYPLAITLLSSVLLAVI
jgi:Ca-activated chloride channel family protein